jgi:3D-(3,5/4)-trihydroxycyclohexane-1,2-dione acylhydrolase (decyclizing)
MIPAPDSEAWWDVPVAETSSLESTRAARERYERDKAAQKTYLKNPKTTVRTP